MLLQKNFSHSEAVDNQIEMYKKQSNSVQLFLDEENYIKSVVQEWQKIFGIALSIKIETYSESKLESKISEGDYDIAYAPLYGDETTALDFLGRFVSDSSDNEINYSSTTYDSIIEDGCYTIHYDIED